MCCDAYVDIPNDGMSIDCTVSYSSVGAVPAKSGLSDEQGERSAACLWFNHLGKAD